MVFPCGIRVVDHIPLQLGVQEIGGDTQGTSARNGLYTKGLGKRYGKLEEMIDFNKGVNIRDSP